MTRYRLTARPDLGPFEYATFAVLAAFTLGVDPTWEAIR